MGRRKANRTSLYGLTIYVVVPLESPPTKSTLARFLANGNSELKHMRRDLRALISTDKQVLLVEDEINSAQAVLAQEIASFIY